MPFLQRIPPGKSFFYQIPPKVQTEKPFACTCKKASWGGNYLACDVKRRGVNIHEGQPANVIPPGKVKSDINVAYSSLIYIMRSMRFQTNGHSCATEEFGIVLHAKQHQHIYLSRCCTIISTTLSLFPVFAPSQSA